MHNIYIYGSYIIYELYDGLMLIGGVWCFYFGGTNL